MKKSLVLALFLLLCSFVVALPAVAADEAAKDSKATDRVQAAGDVLDQI